MEKAYFLDDNNNIVSKEESTHFMVQELDENGVLERETFGITESQMNKHIDQKFDYEPTEEVKNILDNYVDRHGNHMFRK